MDTLIDFMGNPVFGALFLLILVLIGVRQAVFLMARPYVRSKSFGERGSSRLGMLFAVAAAMLLAAGLVYALSPSVREEFAFLRVGVGKDAGAISSRSELCFKRIQCYNLEATRLRCAEADDVNACMAERAEGRAPDSDDACGDFKTLYDQSRVSHAQCVFRNAASVLLFASAEIDRRLARR